MKKILVTGGTGFIGSHTVVILQQSGYEVIVVDNLSNSTMDVLDNITRITGIRPAFEQFDLVDPIRTADFFKRHPDLSGVIHFAAFKAAGESMSKPLEYYRNNVASLINILEGMRDNGIRDIVFSSSCTVYGQPDQLPVTEDAPLKPAWSPYGSTKQICEEILRFSSLLLSVRVISLRYFNPIGAHESALIGELPLGVPNNLIPFITQTAIGKHECLSVYGDDYDTPDGTAIRDYIHVMDLARAHLVAVERMISGKCTSNMEVFNLGTGEGYTVMEVIRSFERVSGVRLNHKIVSRRPGDVEKVWADTRLANDELGWKAERTLDEMVLSAWNWEKALAHKRQIALPENK
ncbi:MAG TPA: UDP-glucose 4-epimerase GalE [Bacteroidales bacterium]|nr:UDP-glucose 4-epimerase GalE [Bacteroidales bacterium]HNS46429.1 UDP-glucose 4-epimerase GalE [Bacteroidales bacterium]